MTALLVPASHAARTVVNDVIAPKAKLHDWVLEFRKVNDPEIVAGAETIATQMATANDIDRERVAAAFYRHVNDAAGARPQLMLLEAVGNIHVADIHRDFVENNDADNLVAAQDYSAKLPGNTITCSSGTIEKTVTTTCVWIQPKHYILALMANRNIDEGRALFVRIVPFVTNK